MHLDPAETHSLRALQCPSYGRLAGAPRISASWTNARWLDEVRNRFASPLLQIALAAGTAMKICLDIRVSTKGGTSTFIDNYVRELDGMRHDHEIQFVFNEGATPLNGRHPRAAAVPYRSRMLEFHWSQWELPRILARQGFDAYHSLKHVGPLRCGSKTVYRVPAVGQFLGNYPMQRLDHVYWKHVAGRAYRKADLLIAVSQYVADALVEHLNVPADRVITVHNGVDSRFRKLSGSDLPAPHNRLGISPGYLLGVGNLVPVKNFATLIRAYAMLSQQHPRLPQLVLAGSQRHAHAAALRALVHEHGLQDGVVFAGYQTVEELVQLYNDAKMLVHPSLHEGFSFTILEAMACGLPIVATANTSIPEAAGDAALYYQDPTDAAQLAAQIQLLLEDDDVGEELAQLGLQRAAEFSWQRCVRKTVQAYDRLA